MFSFSLSANSKSYQKFSLKYFLTSHARLKISFLISSGIPSVFSNSSEFKEIQYDIIFCSFTSIAQFHSNKFLIFL
jgi:hypothetical protein